MRSLWLSPRYNCFDADRVEVGHNKYCYQEVSVLVKPELASPLLQVWLAWLKVTTNKFMLFITLPLLIQLLPILLLLVLLPLLSLRFILRFFMASFRLMTREYCKQSQVGNSGLIHMCVFSWTKTNI